MGSVDIADQLRNSYRPDYFTRKLKWWWSILFWAFGVAEANAWKCYEAISDRHPSTKRLTHYEFVLLLAKQMIWPEDHIPGARKRAAERSKVVHSGVGARGKAKRSKPQKVATLNESNFLSGFPSRLDGKFHPIRGCSGTGATCQFCSFKCKRENPHMFANKKKSAMGTRTPTEPKARAATTKVDVMLCLTCNVRLCPSCYNEFHGWD